MKYRKMSIDGDYSFGQGSKNFLSGAEAVSQAIKTKILLFHGEWWEDIGIGIPFFESILGKMSKENIKKSVQLLVSKRIKEIAEVVSVDKFDTEIDNRSLSIRVECTTSDDEKIETEVVI